MSGNEPAGKVTSVADFALMHPDYLKLYLPEIKTESDLVLVAVEQLESACVDWLAELDRHVDAQTDWPADMTRDERRSRMSILPSLPVWLYSEAAIHHMAAVSHLLNGGRAAAGGDQARLNARAEILRRELDLDKSLPALQRSARDSIVHIDERLDAVASEERALSLAGRSQVLSTQLDGAQPFRDHGRVLIVDRLEYRVEEHSVPIRDAARDIAEVGRRAHARFVEILEAEPLGDRPWGSGTSGVRVRKIVF